MRDGEYGLSRRFPPEADETVCRILGLEGDADVEMASWFSWSAIDNIVPDREEPLLVGFKG